MGRAQIFASPDEAVRVVKDGDTVLVGGFGFAGMPFDLIDALIRHGAGELTIVSNKEVVGTSALRYRDASVALRPSGRG